MQKYNKFIITALTLIIVVYRILILNVNKTEWIDTYYYLGIADKFAHFEYPETEMRLPLYPLLIAIGLPFFNDILWARIVVGIFSVGIVILTYFFSKTLLKLFNFEYKNLDLIPLFSVLLLAVNPTFNYNSIRPLTETPFAFFVLLSFYIWIAYFLNRKRNFLFIFLGLSVGLSSLTRYEGLLLFGAYILTLIYIRKWKEAIYFLITFSIIVLPHTLRGFILSGDFTRAGYIKTPGGFSSFSDYKPELIIFYILYLIFFCGFPLGMLWIIKGIKRLLINIASNSYILLPLLIFAILDGMLTLIWVVSVPRLWMCFIPFISIFWSIGIIEDNNKKGNLLGKYTTSTVLKFFRILFSPPKIYALILFITYSIGVYIFQPVFLFGTVLGYIFVVSFSFIGVIVITLEPLSKSNIISVSKFAIAIITCITVSYFTISNDRYIYLPSYQAVNYANEIGNKIAYSNNHISLREEYIKGSKIHPKTEKFVFLDTSYNNDEQMNLIDENNVDYVLWSNEMPDGIGVPSVVNSENYKSRFKLIKEFIHQKKADKFTLLLVDLKLISEYHRKGKVQLSRVYKVIR